MKLTNKIIYIILNKYFTKAINNIRNIINNIIYLTLKYVKKYTNFIYIYIHIINI